MLSAAAHLETFMPVPTDPKHSRATPATREVYRLTDAEIAELREKFRKSGEWARQQLAIDPELKHLGRPAGWPGTAAEDKQSKESSELEAVKRLAE
ncbi:hypothetical protein RHOFW510R12_01880 [Rhodanobacter sp. FW510-R12]|nr:hypothetical protein RHOFW104R8_05875 [Rhodanobacter sp. FW104-R8]KZC26446.1 hypothetical protein RhoFW510T8_02360 [Rhodanobacter sp. FW510-T8]KZC32181.1 hypothetical protein RhoFW510R10_13465 [Rhodanobacter sp. FW510-R10]